MIRRGAVLLVALLCLLGWSCHGRREPSAERPGNVVLIVVDTLRPDFLGCYGAAADASPNIDALAAEAIVFSNAFAHAPITGPSHASLFSSRPPSAAGVVVNAARPLPEGLPVMAGLLGDAGFATAAAVAIAPVRAQYGFARGFDRFNDALDNSWILTAEQVMPGTLGLLDGLEQPFFLWSHLADPHEPYNAHGLVERHAELELDGRPLGSLSTSSSAVQLIDLELAAGDNHLSIRADDPFMVRRLSLRRRGWRKPRLDPEHPPVEPFTEYRTAIHSWRPKRVQLVIQLSDVVDSRDEAVERYRREVAHADRAVGELLDELERRGLYDEALVVFTSDHGEGLGCHGHMGHIQTLFDCMTRVPLLIKPPAARGIEVGVRRDDLVGLVDLLPTVLAAVGVAPPAGLTGRDLLAGRVAEEPAVFMETHRPQAERTLFGLRGGRHLVVFDPEAGSWQLFDAVADPAQEQNIFDPDDPLSRHWQRRLQERLAGLATPAAGDAVVDEETRAMLRSLGYL